MENTVSNNRLPFLLCRVQGAAAGRLGAQNLIKQNAAWLLEQELKQVPLPSEGRDTPQITATLYPQ